MLPLPPAPVASVPQMIEPFTSVSNAWEQLGSEIVSPPPLTRKPDAMVDVPVEIYTGPVKVEVAPLPRMVVEEVPPTANASMTAS